MFSFFPLHCQRELQLTIRFPRVSWNHFFNFFSPLIEQTIPDGLVLRPFVVSLQGVHLLGVPGAVFQKRECLSLDVVADSIDSLLTRRNNRVITLGRTLFPVDDFFSPLHGHQLIPK